MKKNKIRGGIMAVGILLAGFANAEIHISDDWDQRCCEHREVSLKKIFGINEEILADTNRFPISSDRWHEIYLPKDMGGFKSAFFSLSNNDGKFGIFNVEMKKKLPSGSGDDELQEEFANVVRLVGKSLGIDLKCPKLRLPHQNSISGLVEMIPMQPSTELSVELGGGYTINIEAKDATYIKRNGKMHLVYNASVEVEVRNDNTRIGVARQGSRQRRENKVRPVQK